MTNTFKKSAAFVQLFGSGSALAGIAFISLNGCIDLSDDPATARVASELTRVYDQADSGTDDALCGNGMIDVAEQCDPSVQGWSQLCDEHCRRTAYKACDESAQDCGGNNALCASYATEPGTQFCASFCQNDAACPALPGFKAECNFAWCAVLCDNGQCPAGMTCVRDAQFLDLQGQSRGERDVCVIATTPAPETSSEQ